MKMTKNKNEDYDRKMIKNKNSIILSNKFLN